MASEEPETSPRLRAGPSQGACDLSAHRGGGTVALPWGVGVDGRMRHISAVASGLACECTCPGCGQRLVAKKGQEQAHHFAHRGDVSCRRAYESMLHRLAKQFIQDEGRFCLPPVEASLGSRTVVERGATEFRPDRVEVEVRLEGIQPDVVAYKTTGGEERRLLIEIAVTHFCDEIKRETIRSRQLPAIEIDLSGVSRDAAPDEVRNEILDRAPRRWLFNRHGESALRRLVAEERRKEEAARVRRERAEAAERERVAAAARELLRDVRGSVNGKPSRGSHEQRLGIADMRDAGLGHVLGLEIDGASACLNVVAEIWQGEILARFILPSPFGWNASFETRSVSAHLIRLEMMTPPFRDSIDPAVLRAARGLDCGFRTISDVVHSYLTRIADFGLATLGVDGRWTPVENAVRHARTMVDKAATGRRDIEGLRRHVSDMVAHVRDCGWTARDVQRWLDTQLEAFGRTPRQLAQDGDYALHRLQTDLRTIQRMLTDGVTLADDLHGLPFARFRDARAAELEEREHLRRRIALEEERRLATMRLEEVRSMAIAELGEQEAGTWLALHLERAFGQGAAVPVGLSESQTLRAHRAIQERRREIEQIARREERAAPLREQLLEIAIAHRDRQWAELWMRSPNRNLRNRRPVDLCIDRTGFDTCLTALRLERRKS